MEIKINFGLGIILSIIFLILQLCNVINWPWYVIVLPAVISVAFWLLSVLIVYLIIKR